jgi:hypothetical protein
MDLTDLNDPATTFILGIAASVIVGLVFWALGGRDLRKQTRVLKHAIEIVGRALESEGLIRLNRNDKGEIIGVQHGAEVRDWVRTADNISVSVDKNESTRKRTKPFLR